MLGDQVGLRSGSGKEPETEQHSVNIRRGSWAPSDLGNRGVVGRTGPHSSAKSIQEGQERIHLWIYIFRESSSPQVL